jgi:archaemetzincin
MNVELSRRRILASGLACAAAAACGSDAPAAEKEREIYKISVEEAKQTIDVLKPLHEAKAPPGPRDWLKTHPEDGQTFAQFLKATPKRSCEKYSRLYLQPLGEFTAEESKVLDATADCMQRFFGLPVVTNKKLSLDDLPAKARRVHPTWDVPQVLSTHLLDKVLKPRCPRDAAALLALTASDLWPGEGWNFVFGQASLVDRVGVWSIYRNGKVDGDEDERRMFLRRTLKTALHETGHMFGIPHCIAYECGMNGSNNREESDRQPLEFCPECQAKIWWTCGLRPRPRCEQLLAYGQEHKLAEEARFWERSLAKLKL